MTLQPVNNTAVYLYTPPSYKIQQLMPGALALRYGITTPSVVYRQGGTWFNIATAGMDQPVVADVDVDAASGLRLFFTKPTVIPASIVSALSDLQPADPSWTPASFVQL